MSKLQERLISHAIDPESINSMVRKISQKIKEQGTAASMTVEQQLKLLRELSEFDFGRYLLQNQGVNGYWTHYMLTHPWFGQKISKNNRGEVLTAMEHFVLERAPLMLATQERFQIFLKENQFQVENNASLACIPSGMMGDLLYLDYQGIEEIELFGIDYDEQALHDAQGLAEEKGLANFTKLLEQDAWDLNLQNKFDLISSNGLNIYEPDEQRNHDLYQRYYAALKPGGKLVTSFLTFPPHLTEKCEWDNSKINLEDLMLQKIIFVDLIEARFQHYQSSKQMKQLLEAIGYCDIKIIYDQARMFPTVTAWKRVNLQETV